MPAHGPGQAPAFGPGHARRRRPTSTTARLVMSSLVVLLVAILGAVPAVIGAGPVLAAQESFALLQRQPRVGAGVPLFPANTVRYAWSVYRYADQEIEAYIVPAVAAAAETLDAGVGVWEVRACAGIDLSRVARNEGTLYRAPRERYTLYLASPGHFDAACFFVTSFVEIFEFFLDETPRRIESLRPPPDFPAVIEIRGQ